MANINTNIDDFLNEKGAITKGKGYTEESLAKLICETIENNPNIGAESFELNENRIEILFADNHDYIVTVTKSRAPAPGK